MGPHPWLDTIRLAMKDNLELVDKEVEHYTKGSDGVRLMIKEG